jgi:hypothetical protein
LPHVPAVVVIVIVYWPKVFAVHCALEIRSLAGLVG